MPAGASLSEAGRKESHLQKSITVFQFLETGSNLALDLLPVLIFGLLVVAGAIATGLILRAVIKKQSTQNRLGPDSPVDPNNCQILKHLSYQNTVLKVFDIPANDRDAEQNLFAFDIHGNLLWQIQSTKYFNDKTCPVSNVYVSNGKLMIYRWCGIEEEIDPKSGKILSSELIK